MSSLVEIKDIQTVLGLGTNVSSAVQSQIKLSASTTTLLLQQYLRTTFDRATYSEVFYVNSCEKPFVGENPYLYLKAGNVDMVTTPPVLKRARTVEELTTAEVLDDQFYRVDITKGLVILLPYNYWDIPGYRHRPSNHDFEDDYYVEVTYTAGYESAQGCFQGVPEWLVNAATNLSGVVHRDSGLCCEEDQAITKETTSRIERLIGMLLQPHIRFFPYAIQPIY